MPEKTRGARTKKVHRDLRFLLNRRNAINEQIVESKNAIQVLCLNRRFTRGEVTALAEKLTDRIEELRLMDDENVFVMNDGSRQVLTRRQIRDNKCLIQIEQKARQEKSDNGWEEFQSRMHRDDMDPCSSAASAHAKYVMLSIPFTMYDPKVEAAPERPKVEVIQRGGSWRQPTGGGLGYVEPTILNIVQPGDA